MKYLQEEGLAALTACMTEVSPSNTKSTATSNRLLFGRIEAFTTKRARMEKLMAQEVSERYWNQEEQLQEQKNPGGQRRRRSQSVSSILTPPTSILKTRTRSSSLDVSLSTQNPYKRNNHNSNSIKNSWCRRTYTDLVLTLQASFPDYDFSNIPPGYFVKLPSVRLALFRIQEKLADYTTTNTNSSTGIGKTINDSSNGSNAPSLSMDNITSCLNQVLTDNSKQTNSLNHNNANNNMNKMVEVYSFCPPWEWQGDDDAPTTNHFLTESLVVTSTSTNSNGLSNGTMTSSESTHNNSNTASKHSSFFNHTSNNTINENEVDEWQIVLPSANQSTSDNTETNSPNKNLKESNNSESLVPLWNFNYFFVNKTLKRIVLFTCVETIMTPRDIDMENEDDDEDVNMTTNSQSSSKYYDTKSSLTRDKNLDRLLGASRKPSDYGIIPTGSSFTPLSQTIKSNMKQYQASKSSFTDTASFAGYYSVTDDDYDPNQDEEEEEDEEDEEDVEIDDGQDEDNKQLSWKDNYDMDGDAMGKDAPPVTVI